MDAAVAAVEAELEPFSATGTLATKFWSCPGNAGFKVRGHNYLKVCLWAH
jgi:hypothetical protein